jgi:hypothetical protein
MEVIKNGTINRMRACFFDRKTILPIVLTSTFRVRETMGIVAVDAPKIASRAV